MNLKLKFRDRRHARLVKAARAGDGQAFARLYDELYDPVAGYLGRRLAIPEDAEDLISTVFHRLLQNLERFDPKKGSAIGWAMTMARHALIDHLRRTRETVPVEEMAEVLAGPSNDPLEGLIRTEQADQIGALLQRLPAATREMLALHYGQGLRLREIGDLMDLSEVAVKKRISRARRELRNWLQADNHSARDRQALTVRKAPHGQPCLERSGLASEVDHAT